MKTSKKATKSQRTLDERSSPEAYLRFLKRAALQGIGLDSATMNVDRIVLVAAAAKHEVLPVTLETAFSVLLHTDDRLVVGANFKLRQTRKGNDSEEEVVLLDVACGFSALFNLGLPCNAEMATRFANTEGKLVFWPYLRHFVADATYRMSINPVLVPLVTAATDSEQRAAEQL